MSTMRNLSVILLDFTFCFSLVFSNSGWSSYNSLSGSKLRIVGGLDTEWEDYSFVVSLTKRGQHFCGASIINSNFLITAGHCLCRYFLKLLYTFLLFYRNIKIILLSNHSGTNRIIKPESIMAMIATHKKSRKIWKNSYQISIKKIIPHPEYKCDNVKNDIALLDIEKPLILSASQSCWLPTSPETNEYDNKRVTVLGWGWDNEDVAIGNKPEALQKAYISIISNERCQKSYQENNKNHIISDTQMCAGKLEGGIDACWTDSGGPLIDENKILIGIVSTGVGCARPGLY